MGSIAYGHHNNASGGPNAAPPDARRLLDDLMAMNVADVDRERLVNEYLDSLIRSVEGSGASLERGGKE